MGLWPGSKGRPRRVGALEKALGDAAEILPPQAELSKFVPGYCRDETGTLWMLGSPLDPASGYSVAMLELAVSEIMAGMPEDAAPSLFIEAGRCGRLLQEAGIDPANLQAVTNPAVPSEVVCLSVQIGGQTVWLNITPPPVDEPTNCLTVQYLGGGYDNFDLPHPS